MHSLVASQPPQSSARAEPRLNQKVIGACLRSAFIEALYEDCTEMLPPEPVEPEAQPSAQVIG